MIDLRSQCWVFQHDCQWCVGENMHQVLLEVEGPGKSPKVRNEQLIQYCKIPILGMVHKTWKKYCTASSLLLYLHRNHNIPPANYFSSKNMYILKHAKSTR